MKYRVRYKRFGALPKAGKLLALFTAIALVSGAGAVFAQFAAVSRFGWISTVFREEYSLPFKAYLNISMTNVPLYIDIYDGDEIKISYNNETALIIEENDYSYTITQDADFAFSLFSKDMLEYSAHILLPDRVYREVSIDTASGDVEFLRVYTRILNISSRSGNIYVSEAMGGLRLKSLYGNITADFMDYSENCGMVSESGDINITIPNGRPVWLEYLTDAGSFTSDFFGKEYKNRVGDFFMASGENAKKLSVETVGGNLYLFKTIQ